MCGTGFEALEEKKLPMCCFVLLCVVCFLIVVGKRVGVVFVGLDDIVPSSVVISVVRFLFVVGKGVGVVFVGLDEIVPSSGSLIWKLTYLGPSNNLFFKKLPLNRFTVGCFFVIISCLRISAVFPVPV